MCDPSNVAGKSTNRVQEKAPEQSKEQAVDDNVMFMPNIYAI